MLGLRLRIVRLGVVLLLVAVELLLEDLDGLSDALGGAWKLWPGENRDDNHDKDEAHWAFEDSQHVSNFRDDYYLQDYFVWAGP